MYPRKLTSLQAIQQIEVDLKKIIQPTRISTPYQYRPYTHIAIYALRDTRETGFTLLYETNLVDVLEYLSGLDNVDTFFITELGREIVRKQGN